MTHREHTESRSPATSLRKKMRIGGLAGGCAAVAIAAVVGSSTQLATSPIANAVPKPTATVSGATDYKTGYIWFTKNLAAPYQTMDSALQTFSGGLSSGNAAAVQSACGQLQAASNQYDSALPGPDNRVNGRLSSMVGELNDAVGECRALPAGAGWNEAAGMMSHVNAARARLRGVQQILQPFN